MPIIVRETIPNGDVPFEVQLVDYDGNKFYVNCIRGQGKSFRFIRLKEFTELDIANRWLNRLLEILRE